MLKYLLWLFMIFHFQSRFAMFVQIPFPVKGGTGTEACSCLVPKTMCTTCPHTRLYPLLCFITFFELVKTYASSFPNVFTYATNQLEDVSADYIIARFRQWKRERRGCIQILDVFHSKYCRYICPIGLVVHRNLLLQLFLRINS